MARLVYFGILGALGGSLLAIPLASTMDAGTGADTVVVRAVVILLLMLLGGGSVAAIGVLTRKSKPGEKFLPWQDSLTEPTKPTPNCRYRIGGISWKRAPRFDVLPAKQSRS